MLRKRNPLDDHPLITALRQCWMVSSCQIREVRGRIKMIFFQKILHLN